MPSIGERIHRVRLDVGWSVEECAYRSTIFANAHIDPATWLGWERCSDQQAATNGLLTHLDAISNLLAVDKDWLLKGVIDEPEEQADRVVTFPLKTSLNDQNN